MLGEREEKGQEIYIKSIATLILTHTHKYISTHTYTHTNTGTMGPSHSFAQDEVQNGAQGAEGGVGELYE